MEGLGTLGRVGEVWGRVGREVGAILGVGGFGQSLGGPLGGVRPGGMGRSLFNVRFPIYIFMYCSKIHRNSSVKKCSLNYTINRMYVFLVICDTA